MAFKRVAVWCWYEGAGFHGYQAQAGLRTVQGELLRAFGEAGFSRNPVVAGRTDKHVSARMQVLSFKVEDDVDVHRITERLNPRLPPDVRAHLAADVPLGFHAAFSSSGKEYRYRLPAEPGDLTRLLECAAMVPGTRDFGVFHAKTSERRPRTVTHVELLDGALVFKGHGFARHMVRMLVGGMLGVCRDEIALDAFRAGLTRAVNFNCPTAPPEPLTLWSVEYPRDVDPFSIEARKGFVPRQAPDEAQG